MMKKIIKLISEKYVKGKCHNLCINCENWKICKYDFGFDKRYKEGLQHGYELGYEDGYLDALTE